MEYFWAIIVSIILGLIIWGIASSKIRERRVKKATEKMLPKLKQHFEAGRYYNVFVSHGRLFQRVQFMGISEPFGRKYSALPFPLCQWIVLQQEDGKRLYIKPESIRYYEDADTPTSDQAMRPTAGRSDA
jgi:hypothetical protein